MRTAIVLATCTLFAVGDPAVAFESNSEVMRNADPADTQPYSPFVGRAFPDQVLFGDLHFHTEISFDAGLVGTNLSMHDAFRVARGEKIV